MSLEFSLARLQDVQLVRRMEDSASADASEFTFNHALVQDTAYASLLKQERKRLHFLIAEILERAYPGRVDELAALLAKHYSEAGSDGKTAEYAVRAGDSAARVYAHPEARVHYALALDALSRLPDNDENRRRRVDTLIKQVSVSLRATGPQQSLERMQLAESLLDRVTGEPLDRTRRARIHYWTGHAYVHANQPAKAIEFMQRVLPVAQEMQDPDLLGIPASVIGRALGIQGKFGRAYTLLTVALEPLEKAENWHEWILVKAFQSVGLAMQGSYDEARAAGAQALARATTVGTQTGIGQCHTLLGLVHWAGGDWQQALEDVRLAHGIAERNGDHFVLYLSTLVRALAEMQGGAYRESERTLAVLEGIRQRVGGRLALASWLTAAHASSLLAQNRLAEAMALAEQTMNDARATNDIFAMGLAERVLAQGGAHTGLPDRAEVEQHFTASLQWFQEGDAALEVARTRVAWGKALLDRAEPSSLFLARDQFEKAAAQFETSGLTHEWDEARRLGRASGGLA